MKRKFIKPFKSKKDYFQSMPVPKSGFSKVVKDGYFNIFPTKMKDKENKERNQNCIRIKRPKEDLGSTEDYVMSNIIINKNGDSWFCLTRDHIIKETKEENRNKMCSLDPGIRTFQTVYDNQGQVYKIGNNDRYYYALKNAFK